MNEIVNDKTVLIIDDGMNMWVAERLARDFMTVWLHTPWSSDYPKSQDDVIGTGIPNVIRVSDFWTVMDKADLVVFPGMYMGGLQQHLVSIGKRVFGGRNGDELERYRMEANELFEKLGLSVPIRKRVKGIDALRDHLKSVDDKYIKVSNYRKDFETFHHINYKLTEPVLDELEHKLGKLKDKYEFIVEDPIKGDDICEAGVDTYSADGKYPSKTIFGYEVKDQAYCAHVRNYEDINPLLRQFNEKIAEELKNHQYRQFISTEIRIGKDNIPYILDITCRFPSPPSELFAEMALNYSEILWYTAEAVSIDPIFEEEYGIEVFIDSPWAENKWQAVEIPTQIQRWVKLRNYCIIDGVFYVIPKYGDFDNVGSIVAIGKTMKECFNKVKEYADMIKGHKLEINTGSIDKLNEVIKKGEALNIEF